MKYIFIVFYKRVILQIILSCYNMNSSCFYKHIAYIILDEFMSQPNIIIKSFHVYDVTL